MKELFKFKEYLGEDNQDQFPWLREHVNDIIGVALFGSGQQGFLGFCDRKPDTSKLSVNDRSTVLCTSVIAAFLKDICPEMSLMVHEDPRSAFIDFVEHAQKLKLFEVSDQIPRPFGISSSAVIGNNTMIYPDVRIDANAVVGCNCVINEGSWIQEDAIIGDGAVIGSTGINAYRGADNNLRRFPHLASTIIGKETEVGSNSVVVRGILSSTTLGSSNIIGNLCNIGHGVVTGDSVWMSAGCMIGGHVKLGQKATVGIGSVIRDNLTIANHAQVGMGSVVIKDMADGQSVFGNPAKPVPPIKAGPNR
jgi:UDP-3-O-[3-hydroxymyristoyl] glucosamine N-acyltransferase